MQALSPCKTFRPEQMEWKKHVQAFENESTDDAALAAERIRADDGMSTGFIYRDQRPAWQPATREASTDLAVIEAEFML